MGRHFKAKPNHDSLKYFLEQDYLQKSSKNGSQRCWVMTLKSTTKKGRKMLWQMHSQERMRMWKHFFCAISIIQPDWINEARMNGSMTRKCRHSFKRYNKIPVYLIHLTGKMIRYGTRIHYTYVRIPN